MLLQNINVHAGWVNGTIATIFTINDNNIGIKKEVDGELQRYWVQRVSRTVPRTNYTRNQFPLFPASARTIHKAQSATIDCVAIHLEKMLDHGQLYVAMSRVRRKKEIQSRFYSNKCILSLASSL
jgi:ATP-dependent exoDNAse (exonuclease V) alpha subunit